MSIVHLCQDNKIKNIHKNSINKTYEYLTQTKASKHFRCQVDLYRNSGVIPKALVTMATCITTYHNTQLSTLYRGNTVRFSLVGTMLISNFCLADSKK